MMLPGLRWTDRSAGDDLAAVITVLIVLLIVAPVGFAAEPVSFNRDVRPILSQHCWRCHGFDPAARKSGLRLDERPAALRPADSGHTAIVPGKPDESPLIVRITTTDADLQMPPPEAARRLSAHEISILRRWIAEGAEFQPHWSFEPIKRKSPPKIDGVAHPIDAFVATKLQQHGRKLASASDPAALRRRVSFDLTGLPPTQDDLDRMSTESYEQYVDRLLSSPHYGERMAVDWLDAARYADTDGYFGDKPRQMWLWRDWVIEAFNRNLPFDQFTVEQLAGDLLPDATTKQRIATGFNRNHMSNDETGLIDEEYRVEYVVDRVETTTATWLGLTVGCAQCHDHKYDPISHREYYQLFAFFNNVPETGLLSGHNAPPRISVPSESQQRALTELAAMTQAAVRTFEPWKMSLSMACREAEARLLDTLPTPPADDVVIHTSCETPLSPRWRALGTPLQSQPGIRGGALKFDGTQHLEMDLPEWNPDGPWTIGFWLFAEGSLSCPLSMIEPEGNRRGLEVLWQKGRFIIHLVHEWGTSAIEVATREPVAAKQWHHVAITHDGSRLATGVRVFVDGDAVSLDIRRDALTNTLIIRQPLRIGRRDGGLGYYGLLDEITMVSRTLTPDAIANWKRGERLRGILETPPEKRPARDTEVLLDDYIDHQAEPAARTARDAVRQARAAEQQLKASIPVALVMDELPQRRPTRVLERGQYNKPGDEVMPGVPAALSQWPGDAPRNRLGFARWLVAPDNPLTARVAVNRLWKQCFGEGLVRTINDFGTQGEPPTHPELLDFLAARFQDNGWDVKALLRLIVTSGTYQQRSHFVLQDGEPVDPENRLLARGPSFRLPMEMLRDQALVAAGLLKPRIGGPSVKPYQPPGLWEDVSYNAEESYEPDGGDGLWRRSLYTYVKRQAPPPALLLFDGPTREKCMLARPRTNTPLQALYLLNDDTYAEAARQLAFICLAEAKTDDERFTRLSGRVLSRTLRGAEVLPLRGLLDRQRLRFRAEPKSSDRWLTVGTVPVPPTVDVVELAAWTVVAHTMLNLDEAVTRR